MNILIIDDTPSNLLSDILTEVGYTVHLTNKPADWQKNYPILPDLIFLSLMMPGLDSYEFCQQLKMNEQSHDIPIIFIGGEDNKNLDKAKIFGAGAVDYLSQPFQPTEVLAKVENYLALRMMKRQLQQETSQRHELEKIIKVSEERYRLLSEITSDYAYAYRIFPDGQLEVLWVTEGFKQIYGTSSTEIEEFGGWLTFICPDDRARVREKFQEVLVTGQPYQHEYCLIDFNGLVCWVDDSGHAVDCVGADQAVVVHGAVRNITAKKRASEVVRESEQRLFKFLEALPVGVFILDENGNPFHANQVARQLLGKGIIPQVHSDELIEAYQAYLADTNQLYPADRTPILRALRGESSYVEDMEIHQHDRIVPIEIWGTPIYDEQGFVEYSMVAFADITERKQAEQETYKFLRAVEQSGSTIVITNLEGNIEFVNPAFTTTTGYTTAEAIGNNLRVLKSGHQSAELYKNLWDTLGRGEVWRGELLNKKKNGELYWEFATISPLRNKEGKVTHYLAIKDDITARKKAEESLKKAYIELKRHVDELSALNLIVETVSTVPDLPTALDIVVRTVVRLFNALESIVILLNDTETELTIMAQFSLDGDQSHIGLILPLANHPAIIESIEIGQFVVIPQTQTSPMLSSFHYLTCMDCIQCLLIVPLFAHGKIIGVIILSTDQVGREFSLTEISLTETIAGQIAGAIENNRLFEQEQHQRKMAESLREVATILNSSLDQETVLVKILEQLGRVIQYDSVGVFLHEHNALVLSTGIGINEEHLGNHISVSGENPTVLRCFQNKMPLVVSDIYTDLNWQLWSGNQRIRGWMGAPFLIGHEAIGVLSVESFKAWVYGEKEAQILQAFANQAAIAIQNARLFAEVQQTNQRLQDELAMAREMQYSLLPPARPDWPQLDVVCYTMPVSAVGGDFYTYHAFSDFGLEAPSFPSESGEPPSFPSESGEAPFFPPDSGGFQNPKSKIQNQRYAIAIGDVSGKGVSAALLMATSLSQFDASLLHFLSPVERLAYLDEAISPYTKPRRQNCAMCYVELVQNSLALGATIYIVNAGCIPPYIKRRNGEVENPEIGGFALGQGLGSTNGYEQLTLNLEKGDLIILVSDGVVEANNMVGDMLGFEPFEQIIRHGPTTHATAMLEYLKQEVFAFTGGAEPHDDMTMVVVKV